MELRFVFEDILIPKRLYLFRLDLLAAQNLLVENLSDREALGILNIDILLIFLAETEFIIFLKKFSVRDKPVFSCEVFILSFDLLLEGEILHRINESIMTNELDQGMVDSD